MAKGRLRGPALPACGFGEAVSVELPRDGLDELSGGRLRVHLSKGVIQSARGWVWLLCAEGG